MSAFSERKSFTDNRVAQLLSKLGSAGTILSGNACVYATGSFGRQEASEKSDLDLFIVGLPNDQERDGQGFRKSKLTKLNEILVKAELISATRQLSFPDFDGDGKYLGHYSVDALIGSLGRPNDDASNALTGRLLLFLESRPLLEVNVYDRVIEEVIAAYWGDFESHKESFIPAFLANDILRLWRTFCVNYEASTRGAADDGKRLRRKVKNYKLKHSRMLTCFSALIYLLSVYNSKGTVTAEDAKRMTQLTPVDRLRTITQEAFFVEAKQSITAVIDQYGAFLKRTKGGDEGLNQMFKDKDLGDELIRESYKFGDLIYTALNTVGNRTASDTRMLRIMSV